MEKFSIVIFILAVLVSLSALIEKIRIPHPVFFVVAGLAIGFIPVLPSLILDPEVVFVIFLPPLLYDAAFRTSWHDFKSNIRPITTLAVSLVFFTTISVAIVAHYFIPGFTWPLAFLLGAIISPPDAVAATGIIKGLGLNKRVITILEGESLVNDASALIAYRYAMIAVTTGSFIFWQAGLQFLLITVGGVAVGIFLGHLLVIAHKKITHNPVVETALTLLTPFISYLTAEQLHISGILSVVSTGLYISWHSHEIFSYQTRMRARDVWDTLIFVLNGFVFILMGMQLPFILKQLASYSFAQLLSYSLIISLTTIVVRIIWVFAGAYPAKFFCRKNKSTGVIFPAKGDETTWKNVFIISWAGTRGIISLAAALAIPLTLYSGTVFPQRAMILFICFVVIFITLVVQGLSLKPLVRLLGLKPVENKKEETKELQLYIANSTLIFIDEEYSTGPVSLFKDELKKKYERLISQLTEEIETHSSHDTTRRDLAPPLALTSVQQVRIEIAKFQRNLLLKLHKEGLYNNLAIQEVEREMDIDQLQSENKLPEQNK